MTRDDVIRLLSHPTKNDDEIFLQGVYAVLWCGVHFRMFHQIHLAHVNFDLGLIWYKNKPYPLKPESREALLRWLKVRVQKGDEQVLFTTKLGERYTTWFRTRIRDTIHRISYGWMGVPITFRDVYYSGHVDYYVKNKDLLNTTEIMTYLDIPDSSVYQRMVARSALLGVPLKEQYNSEKIRLVK